MIHKTEHGYSISTRGFWLPGVYDAEPTARYAFQIPDEQLQALSDQVCAVEQRTITLEDLRAARAQP